VQQGLRPAGELRSFPVVGLLWIAVFSLLFTIGSALGLWPSASAPVLLHADLPAGLAFGLVLGASFLRGLGRRPKMSSGWPAAHGGAS
jgi:hypothetical protein